MANVSGKKMKKASKKPSTEGTTATRVKPTKAPPLKKTSTGYRQEQRTLSITERKALGNTPCINAAFAAVQEKDAAPAEEPTNEGRDIDDNDGGGDDSPPNTPPPHTEPADVVIINPPNLPFEASSNNGDDDSTSTEYFSVDAGVDREELEDFVDLTREEDGDESSDDNPIQDETAVKGYQKEFLEALQQRLRDELGGNLPAFEADYWLLRFLESNNWWIVRSNLVAIRKRLGLTSFCEPAYLKEVFVWLPDYRWKLPSIPCACCRGTNTRSHGFQSNHVARRVVGLKENYYILGKRHLCHDCKDKFTKAKEAAVAQGAKEVRESGGDDDKGEGSESYTFMGYDPETVKNLPNGYGADHFPA